MKEKKKFNRFPYNEVSCYGYCLWNISLYHGRDPLTDLLSPWGMRFESDLISRDWWLIDYFEKYTNTCLFKGKWKKVEGYENAIKEIDKILSSNRIVMFQTEWSMLAFHPHYKTRAFNTHAALITSKDNNEILIKDRMLIKIFGKDTVNVKSEQLKEAFDDKFYFFEYFFDTKDVKDMFKEWLLETKSEMEKGSLGNTLFLPHLYYVEGKNFIKYFSQAICKYPKTYRRDRHFVDLLKVRLVDCLNHHIISNRKICLEFLKSYNYLNSSLPTLIEILEEEINLYNSLKEHLIQYDFSEIENVLENINTEEDKYYQGILQLIQNNSL
ncbi:hypothetical protein [Streptococcus sp. 2106]|uniref:hypothetical protein n=1 Tax=Streptococcus sp. 2106 TaxID=2582642 RepID=UPI001562504A|nr:hypothetical protein [Streptococcus sp. 2106]